MKSVRFRRGIAGLIGSALALGGLVTPMVLPRAAVADVTGSLEIIGSAEQWTGDPEKPRQFNWIRWSYTVTNTGSDLVTDLVVTPGSADITMDDCPVASLASGKATTCTGTSLLTQAEIDAGMTTDEGAQATGLTADDENPEPVASEMITTTLPLAQVVSLQVDTTYDLLDLNDNQMADPMEVIEIKINAWNTGNTTLRDVSITDGWGPVANSCIPEGGLLLPNIYNTCIVVHHVTAAEVLAGPILTLTPTVTAYDLANNLITRSTTFDVPMNTPVAPILRDITLPDPVGLSAPLVVNLRDGNWFDPNATYIWTSVSVNGEQSPTNASIDRNDILTYYPLTTGLIPIVYTFTDQTETKYSALITVRVLAPPVIYDPPAVKGANQPQLIDLTTGATLDPFSTYTASVEDPRVGTVSLDGLVATYTPPKDWAGVDWFAYTITDQVGQSTYASATVTVAGAPTLTAPNPATQTIAVGQSAEFANTFTVDTDNGASPNSCWISPAVAGASVDAQAKVTFGAEAAGTYTINMTCQDDLGQTATVMNTVVVTEPLLQLDVVPSLFLGSPDMPMRGDKLLWAFTVTNTGTDQVTGFAMTHTFDDDSLINCPFTTIAAGESTTCSKMTSVTQAQIDVGMVTVAFQATGLIASDSGPVPVASDMTPVTFPLAQVAAVSISQTYDIDDRNGNNMADPGETISLRIVITNTGNVTLHDVTTTDYEGSTIAGCYPPSGFGPTIWRSCYVDLRLTPAEVLAGPIRTLTANVTAFDPAGNPVTNSASVDVPVNVPEAPTPTLELDAGASQTSGDAAKPLAGDEVTWTYQVTNTSSVTLTNLAITPGLGAIGAVTCIDDALDAGQATTCTGTSLLTWADIDAGVVNDTDAQASAEAAVTVLSNLTTTRFEPAQVPKLSTTKTFELDDANGNGKADPGEKVNFTITATNTGNVTLQGVTVTDSWDDLDLTCDPATELAPGESLQCTATYTVQAEDVTSGQPMTNTARTTATGPSGAAVESAPTAGSQAEVPVNHLTPPVLGNLTVANSIGQGSSVEIDIKAGNQWDPNATYTGNATAVGGPATGTASLNLAAGRLTFHAGAAFTGTATIEYEIIDQAGQKASATVTISVAGFPTLTGSQADLAVLIGDTVQITHNFTADQANGASPMGCQISPAVSGATVDDQATVVYSAPAAGQFSINVSCTDSVGQTTEPVTHSVTVKQASGDKASTGGHVVPALPLGLLALVLPGFGTWLVLRVRRRKAEA